ncbi:hypothetical protein NBRC116601_14450 [Cognatishimia sp. WU-CL00825]|uniref:hypothetical protein n=1 Tax=Cognatishimia sp. WU-CL00825 TaxID=3127658 RepID=UPI00310BB6C4
MTDQQVDFDLRLRRLSKQRNKASSVPRSAFIDTDGYVIVRGYRRRRGFPMIGMLLIAIGFFGLKGLMIAEIGTSNYSAKIEELSASNSLVATVGGWTMQPDRISLTIAQSLRGLF